MTDTPKDRGTPLPDDPDGVIAEAILDAIDSALVPMQLRQANLAAQLDGVRESLRSLETLREQATQLRERVAVLEATAYERGRRGVHADD